MVSRKEQFEKEVTVAREELRVILILSNDARVDRDMEVQMESEKRLPVGGGEFVGVEVNGHVCLADLGFNSETDER
jgi:hypothetical protein